ncbi:hypothetical protein BD560DRAFT_396753 [Blakeslea trispora]|nr:hypothetical protein BD560DRAFT_396753 [Blakeslea trispora]
MDEGIIDIYPQITKAMMNFKDSKNILSFELEITQLQITVQAKKYLVNILQMLKSLARQCLAPSKKSVKESELTSSYVHPILSSLFSFENNRPFHCNVREETGEEVVQRPDYRVDLYDSNDQFVSSDLFGEIKPKQSIKKSSHLIFKDAYRLGAFCKNAIKKYRMKAVLAVQVVDASFAFYLVAHDGNKFYTMTELDTLLFPFSFEKFDFSLTTLLKLGYILQVYQSKCKQIEPSAQPLQHSETVAYDAIDELLAASQTTTNECCSLFLL